MLPHGLAGATVTRAMAGFGEKARIRTTQTPALSVDLPTVITIIDQTEMIAEFIPVVQAIVQSGLITVQPVTIIESGEITEQNPKRTLPNRSKR